MPQPLRRLLYRPVHFQCHSRHALRQGGGGTLRAVEPGPALPALWPDCASAGLQQSPAESGNVWAQQAGSHKVFDGHGTGDPTR
jgi:hypothetical protein